VLLRGPDASSQMQQQMYVSLLQNPPFGSLAFVAGTEGDPLRAAAGLSAAMHDVDPSVPVYNVEALSSVSNRFLAPSRLALALIGGFAVVTLVVAAVGLYGLMAQAVAARAREIGIRMALGAEPGRLRRRIVAEGAAVALAGAALGASAAVVSHGAFAAVLPDMTAIDWRTLAGHAAVLLGAAVVATWAPASRAARVDPTVTLRD
jgi:ABC-type antimicrobial peptide transport system permease subunit